MQETSQISSPKFNLSTHHGLSTNRFLSLKKFETDFNITFIHQGLHRTSLIILNLISQILHRLTLVRQSRQKIHDMQNRSELALNLARRWQIPLEHHISCEACLEEKVFPAVHATSTLPWVCFHYAKFSHVPTTYTSLLEYWLPIKHTWDPHLNSVKALDINLTILMFGVYFTLTTSLRLLFKEDSIETDRSWNFHKQSSNPQTWLTVFTTQYKPMDSTDQHLRLTASGWLLMASIERVSYTGYLLSGIEGLRTVNRVIGNRLDRNVGLRSKPGNCLCTNFKLDTSSFCQSLTEHSTTGRLNHNIFHHSIVYHNWSIQLHSWQSLSTTSPFCSNTVPVNECYGCTLLYCVIILLASAFASHHYIVVSLLRVILSQTSNKLTFHCCQIATYGKWIRFVIGILINVLHMSDYRRLRITESWCVSSLSTIIDAFITSLLGERFLLRSYRPSIAYRAIVKTSQSSNARLTIAAVSSSMLWTQHNLVSAISLNMSCYQTTCWYL